MRGVDEFFIIKLYRVIEETNGNRASMCKFFINLKREFYFCFL